METKRIFDFIEYQHKNYPIDDSLTVKRNGKWDKFSTEDVINISNSFSYGLLELGVKKGDKIVTISNNRPEWNFADTGLSQIGAIHVPVYPNISEEEYEHILKHSEAKFILISSKDRFNYIKPIANRTESIEKIYTLDKIEGVANFSDIIKLGKKNEGKYKEKLEQIKDSIKEDDVCSIIYTSGTTGLSKGVMITHKNFVSNVKGVKVAMPEGVKIALSFLPLNHVFERILNYLYMFMGISINYAESTDTLINDMNDIKPHIFGTVPRVLEKVYDKIYSKGLDLSGIKRFLFFWALRLAKKYDPQKQHSTFYTYKLSVANKLIFCKWRDALGGRIIVVVSGGASLQARLTKIFCAAGIPILEGYGLTETSPVISVNRPKDIKPGTVGKILEHNEVKIAKNGEILFKGPNLMKGYYKNDELTAEVIDKEGWFHTGDQGRLDGDNLKITGRIKEIFKLSTGKYIAPQIIENKFKESTFIEQLMVVGEGKQFCAAVVCPNFPFLHDWASGYKIHYRNNLELIKNEAVIERFQREVDEFNQLLDDVMKIKKFSLVCEEWSVNSGELSPTLKLKRNIIARKYKVKLSNLYEQSDDEGHIGKFD